MQTSSRTYDPNNGSDLRALFDDLASLLSDRDVYANAGRLATYLWELAGDQPTAIRIADHGHTLVFTWHESIGDGYVERSTRVDSARFITP